MKHYKPESVCIKCGCPSALVQYKPEASMYINDIYIADSITPEHMLRTCRNCGYTWQEAPLDSLTVEKCECGNNGVTYTTEGKGLRWYCEECKAKLDKRFKERNR